MVVTSTAGPSLHLRHGLLAPTKLASGRRGPALSSPVTFQLAVASWVGMINLLNCIPWTGAVGRKASARAASAEHHLQAHSPKPAAEPLNDRIAHLDQLHCFSSWSAATRTPIPPATLARPLAMSSSVLGAALVSLRRLTTLSSSALGAPARAAAAVVCSGGDAVEGMQLMGRRDKRTRRGKLADGSWSLYATALLDTPLECMSGWNSCMRSPPSSLPARRLAQCGLRCC